jgi:hypothetical protein
MQRHWITMSNNYYSVDEPHYVVPSKNGRTSRGRQQILQGRICGGMSVANGSKKLENTFEKNFHFNSMVHFNLVALKTLPGRIGCDFWNGLCSRTYASGCKILTVLKENKKFFSCKGKGRNFSCIEMSRHRWYSGVRRKEKKAGKIIFSVKRWSLALRRIAGGQGGIKMSHTEKGGTARG